MHSLSVGMLIEGHSNFFTEKGVMLYSKFKGMVTEFSAGCLGEVIVCLDVIWVENVEAKWNRKATCYAKHIRPVMFETYTDDQF